MAGLQAAEAHVALSRRGPACHLVGIDSDTAEDPAQRIPAAHDFAHLAKLGHAKLGQRFVGDGRRHEVDPCDRRLRICRRDVALEARKHDLVVDAKARRGVRSLDREQGYEEEPERRREEGEAKISRSFSLEASASPRPPHYQPNFAQRVRNVCHIDIFCQEKNPLFP